VDIDDAGGAAEGWARLLRRPSGLVEQTRWMLWLAVLAGLMLVLPWVLDARSPVSLPLALVAMPCLIACWTGRYLTRQSPLPLDLGEAVATAALATAMNSPATVLGLVMLALWYRALYGSDRRVVLFTALMLGGLVLALPVGSLLPGRAGSPISMAVLASLPVVVLTMVVARHHAICLFSRSQSRERDAALVRLGHDLIGLTDRAAIHARSRECSSAICAATPQMRALFVLGAGPERRIEVHAGRFRCPPATLGPSVLPAEAGLQRRPWPVLETDELDVAAGVRCQWVALPLPEEPDGWLILGTPHRVPPEAVAAMQSMINQAALALRTSAAHQDLATQAQTDGLTALPNRAAFITALEFAIADPQRLPGLLFIDLDDFKLVNDRYGHVAGDELLQVIAARLCGSVRPQDMCARLGGDEFAVLLQDAEDSTEAIGRRLASLISAPVSLGGRIVHVGASIGVALAAAGSSAERLVQQADIAMYAAKAKGKNRVQVFEPGLLRNERAGFEAELAAAAGAGQLIVHYQPIVAVADGRCVAVEALVRWQHPTRGLLGPGEFIPVAESSGAIIGIGAYVLRRACADAVTWIGPSGRLALHVNVSAAQLTDPDFFEVVRGCLTEFEMSPRQLVLEITESMVLETPSIREALDRLSGLGVELAIDDFGTGYSALSTLRALPLDIVKLDKSFIAGGRSHAVDEAVVGAIVQLAGRLGLQIVAEGVERLDQQQFVRDVGADAAQGYLHLRPTSADEFANWLTNRSVPAPRTRTDRAVTPVKPLRSV
jgi:diguanylate cyclase (GGDEF)-like protein